MPRKKKSFDYNDTFPTRLRNLINENKDVTQDKVAEIVGVTRQTVGNWCSGDSSPDAAALCKIADIFDVSIDWLMRENAPQKINATLAAICDYTNLNEKAINIISSDEVFADFINNLMESEYAILIAESLNAANELITNARDALCGETSIKTPVETLYEGFRLNRFEAINEFTLFVNNRYKKAESEYRKHYLEMGKKLMPCIAMTKSDCITLDSEDENDGEHNETQK